MRTSFDENTAITTSTLDQIQPQNVRLLRSDFWWCQSIDGAIPQNSFTVEVKPQKANDSFICEYLRGGKKNKRHFKAKQEIIDKKTWRYN